MGMSPTLHVADIGDVDAIMTIMTAAFDPVYGEAWTAGQVASLFALPAMRVVLAHSDGAARGFYAARCAGPESELLLLAVDPAHRRAGLGRSLLLDWIAWATRSGCDMAFLEMRSNNPALALYEQQGFQQTGLRPNYYLGTDNQRHDAKTMARHLGSDMFFVE